MSAVTKGARRVLNALRQVGPREVVPQRRETPEPVNEPTTGDTVALLEEAGERIRLDVLRQLDQSRAYQPFVGEASVEHLPIIMCLWDRRERFEEILRMVDGVDAPRPLRLILWNDNEADSTYYRERLEAFTPEGAIASIEFHSSSKNIRGIARFLAVVDLDQQGYRGPIVTLDDDQIVQPDFVTRLLQGYEPQTVSGYWAWSSRLDDYGARRQPPVGEIANYVGTGGAIFDSQIVRDRTYFTSIPRNGVLIEDVWMTRWAQSRGWRTFRADINVHMVEDGRNQFSALIPIKMKFWLELQERFPVEASEFQG
ncbi:hypothetical protein [Pseudoclavibacter sp. RFBB5]|uniref:hypothetical protein n=1 Tax=Pseudoclavibacter sp. RFBB5 TaxID=2080574 RepID=UPI0011B002A0|nr:hypothetical protein [Pseudoclavibacter sp. RFBB5]